ncbi:periplasmic binding protein-like II [Neocallimastix lanati (nom. inval.)]|uniref:Periplasmic binding protein-like II n=1 Tax=Neocallimastix californiae TaxID=1754190 RepID=A0A1Y2FTF0_9FUNG|nr:periplasmic binding protein-like II [Neocallimastix sp. JGI-2020a]ORY87291.1 periplasmic binding protein-like II [Neocallimastix californiae]|eukprot:ORY87291.1 periplasmic binding protein-like II [Neocallimastix californiae]
MYQIIIVNSKLSIGSIRNNSKTLSKNSEYYIHSKRNIHDNDYEENVYKIPNISNNQIINSTTNGFMENVKKENFYYINNNNNNNNYNYEERTYIEIDKKKYNVTIKSYTFLLNNFKNSRSIINSNNNDDKGNTNYIYKRNNNENITIRGFFDTSLPGITSTTIEKELFEKLLEEWAPENLANYKSVTFELTFANESVQTTDYENIISQQLNRQNSKYDFFMIDCVWTGRYGEHLLDLQGKINSESVKMHNQVNLDSCTHENKLKALPLYSDYGILLYRKDLLEKYHKRVPLTWDELETTALYIIDQEKENGNKNLEGYAGQFKSYEGLTCNIYEWIFSYRKNLDTKVNYFNDDFSLTALKKLISFFDKSVISHDALIYDESHSLERWEKGNVIFLRNWPNSVQNTEDSFNITGINFSFDIAKLPGKKAGFSASTLGGWNIGVSKYSNNPLIAARVVEFLTGEYTQKLRALNFGLLPTIKSLYYDEDVCKVIKCDIYKGVQGVSRPSDDENYLDYSKTVYETIYKALQNTITPEEAINTIKRYTNVSYIKYSNPITILVIGCTIICQLILILVAYLIFKFRKLKFIEKSNTQLSLLFLFGLFLQSFMIFSLIGNFEGIFCSIKLWIFNLSTTIILWILVIRV